MLILECGYLGVGATGAVAASVHPRPLSFNLGRGDKVVSGGWGCCFAVSSSGTLYAWGSADHRPETGSQAGTVVELAHNVQDAAAGWDHTLVLCKDGEVFSTVQVQHQLAPEPAVTAPEAAPAVAEQQKPGTAQLLRVLLANGVRVVAVAAGELHSLALSAPGHIYAWGENPNGQLGIGSRSPCAVPAQIHIPGSAATAQHAAGAGIIQIACGDRHSCAVTATGRLFCWGWSLHGQCGGGAAKDELQPKAVAALGGLTCICVAAGLGHTVVATDAGAAYAWGWNGAGQLGVGDDMSREAPTLLDAAILEDEHITQVACGGRHSVVLTRAGRVFSWGWNKWGQLGIGSNSNQSLPIQVRFPADASGSQCAGVACGSWHTLFLLQEISEAGQQGV